MVITPSQFVDRRYIIIRMQLLLILLTTFSLLSGGGVACTVLDERIRRNQEPQHTLQRRLPPPTFTSMPTFPEGKAEALVEEMLRNHADERCQQKADKDMESVYVDNGSWNIKLVDSSPLSFRWNVHEGTNAIKSLGKYC